MTSVLALEASGNQAFIYRSNRLREAIGASELLAQLGTTWLKEACVDFPDVQIVVSTSAKGVVIGSSDDLREILTTITTRALVEAPGLDVVGAIADMSSEDFFSAMSSAFARISRNRAFLNGPESRFPRLPIVDSCVSTGLPAQTIDRHRPVSFEVATKIARASEGIRRQKVDGVRGTMFQTLEQLERFETDSSWIAVVHADGNGLGRLFMNFEEHLRIKGLLDRFPDWKGRSEAYRRFSVAVETCTRNAYRKTVSEISGLDVRAGLVPVLIGGDDITIITTGDVAMTFALSYCRHFESECAENSELQDLAIENLTASASVVWTKPHFPYWSSYEMAASLLDDTKDVGRRLAGSRGSVSSLVDLRVMFDSSVGGDVSHAPDGSRMHAGPFSRDSRAELWGVRDLEECLRIVSLLPSNALHSVRDLLSLRGSREARQRIQELMQGQKNHQLWQQILEYVPDDGSRPVLLMSAMDVASVVGSSLNLGGIGRS